MMHFSLFVPFNRVGEIVADARLIPSESYVSTQIWSFLVACVTIVEIIVRAQHAWVKDVLEFD